MQISLQPIDPFSAPSDALIVPVLQFGGAPDFDVITQPELRSQLAQLVADADFTGKAGSTLLVQTMGLIPPRRLVLAGAGDREKLTAEGVRKAWGSAVTKARDAGAKQVVSLLPPSSEGLSGAAALAEAVAAAALATYRFTAYQGTVKNEKPVKEIDALTFAGEGEGLADQIARGEAVAAAVNLARDVTNEPGSDLPPMAFAAAASQVAEEHGLEITIYDANALQEMGANAILAVGKGSANPPCMIHMVYRPEGATDSTPSLGLVGKCITFDTGGYSIKPADGMGEMKGDMGGGAAVLGVMAALKAAGVQAVVHAVICSAENKISGEAFLPGDVIRGMNGVTMEIISTDAEGRLVMADGLVYLARQGVREMVDISTLTGAKIIALGNETVALFANNDDLADRILGASEYAAEPMWRLPLSEHLESQIEAEIADIKNTGGRAGGSITAALFLQHFSEGLPWAHLDIAGSNRSTKSTAYAPKGSNGVMVRTLLEYLRRSGG
ncbi:MAG: leucyl aminopeptidase [Thermomicrobiales bacterium]|nr:leucyl aminopeptidase [Thermomicrobiales bacterium]